MTAILWPDLINGLFEVVGGLLIWLNVYQLHKDKKTKGIHPLPTLLFLLWGYWNLYYYPHLSQWFSFAGGILLVVANTIWVWQMYVYRKN